MGEASGDAPNDAYLYTFDLLDDPNLDNSDHADLPIPVPVPVPEPSRGESGGTAITVDEPSHSTNLLNAVVGEVAVSDDQVVQPERRHPLRYRRPPEPYWASLAQSDDVSDPADEKAALSGPEASLWKQAMDEEMLSFLENGTWSLVPIPVGVNHVPVKWVFKKKRDAAGNVERYKARLVAKGYRQVEGIDYSEVSAPVSKHTTLRT